MKKERANRSEFMANEALSKPLASVYKVRAKPTKWQKVKLWLWYRGFITKL